MAIHINIELNNRTVSRSDLVSIMAGRVQPEPGKLERITAGRDPGKPQPERSRSGYPWGIWGGGGGVRKCLEYSQKLKRNIYQETT